MPNKAVIASLLLVCSVAARERPNADLFYQAIRNDDLSTLQSLVKELGVDAGGAAGDTPLMLASAFGSSDAVRLLLDAGANANAASTSGATALHWSRGEPARVRLLLEHGADVNARTADLGRTPLVVLASSAGTAEAVGLLLAKGADVNAADSSGITPLLAAASVDDTAVATLLLAKGADVNARADVGGPATPLMAAAYNGNADLTRLFLAHGATIDAVSAENSATVKNGPVLVGHNTALHLSIVNGNPEVVRLLLGAGAAVDSLDVRGTTPLMWSIATDRPDPRIVRMLLEKGADPELRSKTGESASDWARLFNNPIALSELKMTPTKASTATAAPGGTAAAAPDAARRAVERSMPLLRKGSAGVGTNGACVACHAQPLTAMAIGAARARGWQVAAGDADSSASIERLAADAPTLLEGREGGGLPDVQLYIGTMMAALKSPAGFATDSLVHYVAAKQHAQGNWGTIGPKRAPIQDGDFARTAMAIRTLVAYATPARKAEMAERVERAARSLAAETPVTTQDRVMQLLGLQWANADAPLRATRTQELLKLQRPDGGWAQTPHLASDAYATGQVLFALGEIGARGAESALQSGAAFLVRTQKDDGTWHVRNRAMKFQPYFASGFPYGHDQWISHAATAWAAIGLSRAAVERPSLASVGAQGNDNSGAPVVSDDGPGGGFSVSRLAVTIRR